MSRPKPIRATHRSPTVAMWFMVLFVAATAAALMLDGIFKWSM